MSRRPAASPTAVTPPALPGLDQSDSDRLSPDQVIDELHQQRTAAHQAEVREIELAVDWALLHPCPEDGTPASWGDGRLFQEQVTPLAGPGAPTVAEFAPADLAAALGVSFNAGRQLLADALELTYRLPTLWSLVHSGKVPVWLGRSIARETHDLSEVAVAHADRLICAVPSKIGQVRARRLIDEARLYHDPDRAQEDERQALAERHVTLSHTKCPATQGLHLMLDRADAERFDHSIAQIAAKLSALGDDDGLDVRRARAVGILADPQHTLDFLARDVADRSDPFTAAREALSGIGPKTYSGAVDGTGPVGGGTAVLYLHLTPDDLAEHLEAGTGTAVIERIGATSLELVETWLAGRTFTVRPVLDLTHYSGTGPGNGAVPSSGTGTGAGTEIPLTGPLAPRDGHDPSPAMREVVFLRDATCVFPGCRRDSRGCDLDHIEAWVDPDEGGPPGQTNLVNLAPLCRLHHRIKTFTDWDYERLLDGRHLWVSPTGHSYVVEPAPRHIAASA